MTSFIIKILNKRFRLLNDRLSDIIMHVKIHTRECAIAYLNRVPRRISVYPEALNSRPLTSGAILKGRRTVVSWQRERSRRAIIEALRRRDASLLRRLSCVRFSWTPPYSLPSPRAVRSNQEPII